MNRTVLFVLSKGARKARALVRADRDHRVVLDEPFFVGTFRETFRWEGRDLPILPFGQLRRAADRCPSGCELCKRRCPVSVRMDEDNLRKGECIACERCADTCPHGNLSRWDRTLLRRPWIGAVLKAAAFFALGAALGLCRFL